MEIKVDSRSPIGRCSRRDGDISRSSVALLRSSAPSACGLARRADRVFCDGFGNVCGASRTAGGVPSRRGLVRDFRPA